MAGPELQASWAGAAVATQGSLSSPSDSRFLPDSGKCFPPVAAAAFFLLNEKFSADFHGNLRMGRQGEKVDKSIPKRGPKNSPLSLTLTHTHTHTLLPALA